MELSLSEFVILSLAGSCLLVLFWTVTSRTLHARSESRSLARRVICRLCLHAFEDRGSGRVVDCPRCGAATEKGRNRRLG